MALSPVMRGVWCEAGAIRLRRDVPIGPEPPGEVALNVRLAGICDTDLQLARGYMGFVGVLGHEFVGVEDSGRRYVADINAACGRCETCMSGLPGHCPNRTVLGILGRPGAMADRVVVPRSNLHAVPDGVDDLDAVLIEPLAAAYRAVEQTEPVAGLRLAVVGDGKLGILCARAFAASGATVTLVGKHPRRLALAGERIATFLLERIDGLGKTFDVVVEATGSPSGLPTALGLVRPCGTVVLKTTVAAEHRLSLAPLVIDEIRVIGSRCGPFPRAIAALESGEVVVRDLVQSVRPLDEAEAAFAEAATPGAGKVVLRP